MLQFSSILLLIIIPTLCFAQRTHIAPAITARSYNVNNQLIANMSIELRTSLKNLSDKTQTVSVTLEDETLYSVIFNNSIALNAPWTGGWGGNPLVYTLRAALTGRTTSTKQVTLGAYELQDIGYEATCSFSSTGYTCGYDGAYYPPFGVQGHGLVEYSASLKIVIQEDIGAVSATSRSVIGLGNALSQISPATIYPLNGGRPF